MLPTVDPSVFIEEQKDEYVRYRNTDGRRWEVLGTCRKIGECVVGAVLPDGHVISGLDDPRLPEAEAEMDTPITPEFDICCVARGWLTVNELEPVK